MKLGKSNINVQICLNVPLISGHNKQISIAAPVIRGLQQ